MTVPIDDAHWREQLGQLQIKLRAELASAAESSAPVELDQSRVGRLSRMDALQTQAMSKAADQRRQRSLQQIGAALVRLDAGTFGQCIDCGEAIARLRLASAPANPLCLACAEDRER
jgi:DnaK suppressor protein